MDDARKDALIIRKNSVQTMKSHRLYVMPVTTGFAAAPGRCLAMPSMLSSSMNRCSESRKGISSAELSELNRINDTITLLPKKGQSLLLSVNITEMSRASDRTIYSFIDDAGLLDARNIDLRRKLRAGM